jgi:hypothetical protein
MKISDGLTHRLAEYPEERCLRRIDGDNLEVFLPKRRRDFRADEPHAHDDDSATGNHLLPNTVGVLDGAKTVNTFKIATGNGDAPVTPARGDEQRVERHATVIVELHESR